MPSFFRKLGRSAAAECGVRFFGFSPDTKGNMARDEYEKPDFWSRKAFAEGYPARSVYKLAELNGKFALFAKHARVLDLGAAPGSWTLFALRLVGERGQVAAVDMSPLSLKAAARNLVFIQGNLYDSAVRGQAAALGPYHAVLCDAAPPTTGNRTADTARSLELAECAVGYAQDMLAPGGNFAVKLFQGGGESALLRLLRERFAGAKTCKPKACRSGSCETYAVGLGLKSN